MINFNDLTFEELRNFKGREGSFSFISRHIEILPIMGYTLEKFKIKTGLKKDIYFCKELSCNIIAGDKYLFKFLK